MASPKTLGGRYEIKEPPIGQGGMGIVYRAYDTVTKRFVAVKTIGGDIDASGIELFEKEWSVLARLSHPNIVDILDTGGYTDSGHRKPYFVMPLLPGVTLDRLIASSSGRLTVDRVVEIITQACRGLQVAHDQGLVHRDLKPSNIFVMEDDTVKIIDFGVVHLTDIRSITGLKGTPQYMAPEQLELRPATPASDIFSLGVVCYEALTGRKPFWRSTEGEIVEAIRHHVPPPVSEINPATNELVSRTVHKALAKQAYHRFSSAKEFADTLRKALRNEHIELFDRIKIQPRIARIKKAFKEGDCQFAMEILNELESEGNIDPEMSALRIQIEQAMRSKTVRQLLDSARTRLEEEEYPLALQKVQSVLEIDPANADAIAIRAHIHRQRNAKQVDSWFRLAHQHLNNQLFSQARQACDEILKIDSSNTRAREFLATVDAREQEIAKLRKEKQQYYEMALTSYKNGDISTALSKLEKVLELERHVSPNSQSDAQYQVLYNQIRSERDAMHNAYSEGRKALADRHFQKALEICDDFLRRRPGDPMFQSLKIEVEEAQRQEKSAAIAAINSRVDAEPDLDRKLNILNEACERHPDEVLFRHSLKLIKERRDLVNTIVTRARYFEEQGQFVEANGQWDILRNIYGQYPGLDFEIQRVQRLKEEQARDEAKANRVEKIDRYMAAGQYGEAVRAVDEALAEFPGDGELQRLRGLAEHAERRASQAKLLFEEGQHLYADQNQTEGIAKLREARQLDEKNAAIRAGLLSALIEHARSLVSTDWRRASEFVTEALEIKDDDPVARSLAWLIKDYERRDIVDRHVAEARDLQEAGNLQAALKRVEQALGEYPNEIRLSQFYGTLNAALEASRTESRRKGDAVATRTTGPPVGNGNSATASSLPTEAAPVGRRAPVAPAAAATAGTSPEAETPPAAARGHLEPIGPSSPLPPGQARGRKFLWLVAGLIGALVIVAIVLMRKPANPPPPPRPEVSPQIAVNLESDVPGTRFEVDGKPVTGKAIPLMPGSHTAKATADGYKTEERPFEVSQTQPARLQFHLQPALPQLRFVSDLKAGHVLIDGLDIGNVQEGSLLKNEIAAGDHTIKVLADSRQLLAFDFHVKPGTAVTLTTPIQVANLPVLVVSSKSGTARIFSTTGFKAGLAGQPQQPVPSVGLELESLSAGANDLVISDGRTERHLTLDTTANPVLTIQLGATADTGTLIVESNVPDAQLSIDGTVLKKGLSDGTRLVTLVPKSYNIKVFKEGYEDAEPKTVEITKGEQKTLSFDLTPVVTKAALEISDLPPGTEVLIDGQSPGATGAAGALTADVVAGKHKIVFQNSGYESAPLMLELRSGVNKISASSYMKPAKSSLTVRVTPGTAKVTYRRSGAAAWQTLENGSSVTLEPGTYTVSSGADGYAQRLEQVSISPGKSSALNLELTKVSVVPQSPFEDPEGWKEDGHGWLLHEGAGLAWLKNRSGEFEFVIYKQTKSGLFGKSKTIAAEWVVDFNDKSETQPSLKTTASRIEYAFDGKQLRRKSIDSSGDAKEQKINVAPGSAPYFVLDLSITSAQIAVKIDGHEVDTVQRVSQTAPVGKTGFHGPIQLSVRKAGSQ